METDFSFEQLTLLAAVIWAVVEQFKPIWDKEKQNTDKTISLIVSLVLSVIVNIFAGLDIFDHLGIPLTANFGEVGRWIGIVLTGILGAQGASLVHDAAKLLPEIQKTLAGLTASRINVSPTEKPAKRRERPELSEERKPPRR